MAASQLDFSRAAHCVIHHTLKGFRQSGSEDNIVVRWVYIEGATELSSVGQLPPAKEIFAAAQASTELRIFHLPRWTPKAGLRFPTIAAGHPS
jgi:hypothetical protein